jgi:hypothetical protein
VLVSSVADTGLDWLICTRQGPSRWPRCLGRYGQPRSITLGGDQLTRRNQLPQDGEPFEENFRGFSQGSPMAGDRKFTVRNVKNGEKPLLWSVSSDMSSRFGITHLELLIIKPQIFSHSGRLGISDIGAVEKSHKI